MNLDLEIFQNAWNEFITGHKLNTLIDPVVANSWERCWARLNPLRQITPIKLSPERIVSIQKTNTDLMTVARPIMEDIYQYIERSDTAVVLMNSAGYVLDLLGDPSILQAARPLGIEIGGSVSEGQLGTNALTLPLLDGVPARTVGAKHYLKDLHWLGAAAAPVFSITGRPLGALGVISFAENYHPHSLGAVVAGAKAIEGQLQIANLLEEQNSQLSELNTILTSMAEGILVWDARGIIIQANSAAMRILNWPVLSFVGRPLEEYVDFPEYIEEALEKKQPLKDVEVTIGVGEQLLNCVVSLNFVPRINAPHWVIMTLRPAELVHQLVNRQVGAQISFTITDFVGKSAKIQQVRRMVRAAAPAQAGILIRGESGTGKNMLARAIHQESPRKNGPFLIFNCASIPNEFILTELLGVGDGIPGSVIGGRPSKFELVQGGTLYFQDIDQLPLQEQTILLNVIDLGIVVRLGSARPIPVDVRIIDSTAANLKQMIAEGNFRSDLYYRLSPFEMELPPLRERKSDIPLLAERILERQTKQHGKTLTLDPELIPLLKKYPWPGNIRELEAILERAVVQAAEAPNISSLHLPEHILNSNHRQIIGETESQTVSLIEMEREAILAAAQEFKGNLSQMAKCLGLSRTTIWRKMKLHDLPPNDFRASIKNQEHSTIIIVST